MKMIKLPIETPNPIFGRYLYPAAKEIMEKQQDVTWTAPEVSVDKDKHDYMVVMSEAQSRLSKTTLQLFVEIEQEVGEVWEKIAKWYPHSEIEGACIEIARMEKAVHAFFYQKMSDVLNIDPEETIKQQQEIKVLKNKLELLKRITSNLDDDKPLSLATVAAIEQVLLFSNFGMLKSFKANGHNLVKNTLLGVDYVIQDETLHGVFATYLHNTHIAEHDKIEAFPMEQHKENVLEVIHEIVKHEDDVIDYVYEGEDTINDISAIDLKTFIRSRANIVLFDLLGIEDYYMIEENKIAEWFYQGVKSIKLHDFFSAGTNQYKKNWDMEGFSMAPFLKERNEK